MLNDFKIIDFIKSNATTLIQNEKLDLISVTMIHLYGENYIEMIINRFNLNKRNVTNPSVRNSFPKRNFFINFSSNFLDRNLGITMVLSHIIST